MTCAPQKLTHAIPVTQYRYSKKKNKKVPSTSGDNVREALGRAAALGCVSAGAWRLLLRWQSTQCYWYRGSRALESKFG